MTRATAHLKDQACMPFSHSLAGSKKVAAADGLLLQYDSAHRLSKITVKADEAGRNSIEQVFFKLVCD
jgi:hypothetical protein